MPIPEEIRAVKRPPNTVVSDNGRDGPKRYAVRERNGYVKGKKNPMPVNGRTVGYIVDGKYVPCIERTAAPTPKCIEYGSYAFAVSVSSDILDDLRSCFEITDAETVYCAALIRAVRKSCPNSRLKTFHERSALSVRHTSVRLSKNSFSDTIKALGADSEKRIAYNRLRLSRVCPEHMLAIDGMLKQCTSEVSTLSMPSRKCRVKGILDINVLFLYDADIVEMVASEVYAGNCPDSKAYPDFIAKNSVEKGIVVGDKAFGPRMMKRLTEGKKDLHYFLPLKRGSAIIKKNEMLKFDSKGQFEGKTILYRKRRDEASGTWLYSFRDPETAFVEEIAETREFDGEAYERDRDGYGSIVFQSDIDIDPMEGYRMYAKRWDIERAFDSYKNDLGLDATRVQTEVATIGSEFINGIATTVELRMVRKAEAAGLLKNMSFRDLIDDLSTCWRKGVPAGLPSADDKEWGVLLDTVKDEMTALGLIAQPVKRKRGRPKGSKNKKKASEAILNRETKDVTNP